MIIHWKWDRVPDELWNEVHDIVQETGIKTTPIEKKCKKAKWLSGEALEIAVKRRELKSKGEKFSVHALLKPSLKDFEHFLAIMWNECNCMVIWTFFGMAFLWNWNENGLCPSPVATDEFSNLLVPYVECYAEKMFK